MKYPSSPFPEEQEVIVEIDRCTPFYNPRQFLKCAKNCKTVDCYHARSFLKEITLVNDNLKESYFQKHEKNWKKMMKRILEKFKENLDKGLVLCCIHMVFGLNVK